MSSFQDLPPSQIKPFFLSFPSFRAKVEAGNGCSVDILRNHLLHNSICAGVIEGKARTANALKKYLIVDRDESDTLTVEGVE